MHTLKTTVLIALSTMVISQGLNAQIINVDFNTATSPTYSGLGAAVDAPANNLWNGFTVPTGASSITDLTTSAGAASTVDLSLSNVGFVFDGVSGGGTGPTNDLLRDFAIATGNSTATFTFSGLASGGVYDLYLYGINGGYNDRGTNFTIGATTLTTTNTNANGATFTLGDNYVLFSNVTATVGGEIAGTWTANPLAQGGTNNEGLFNGAQIVAVPEPSTWVMASLGMFALLVSIRRRGARAGSSAL